MNTPCWDMPPPGELLVSAMTDDLSFEHVRDRLERMLEASDGLSLTGVSGSFGQDQIGFASTSGCHVTLRPHKDGLTVDAYSPSFSTNLKMPPDRSGSDVRKPETPGLIIRCALHAMDAHRVRSSFTLGSSTDGEQLMAGMTDGSREATASALRTCCALIGTANPWRRPESIVRIHLPSPFRQARIVDARGAPLFRKNVERALTRDLPSVLTMSSHAHGYVAFDHTEVSMAQKDMHLDAMSILRVLTESGIDPDKAVLSAAMTP